MMLLLVLLLQSFYGMTPSPDALRIAAAYDGQMPDLRKTPGVARKMSTATVCSTKWGKDERAVTLSMKKQVFAAYGIPYAQHAKYEVDHLISRELAGADDVKNLWPQPYAGTWNAHMKDRLENRLHVLVCSKQMKLADAQDAIRIDWIAKFRSTFPDDVPSGKVRAVRTVR